MVKKLSVLALIVLLWEAVVMLLALRVSSDIEVYYQLAARYSARTSFVLMSSVLLWVGICGLRIIFKKEPERQSVVGLITAFSVNHLIHFCYLFMHYRVNDSNVFELGNFPGALSYVAIVIVPIYLWDRRVLTVNLYRLIYAFIFGIIAIFGHTYWGRISYPDDTALASPKSWFVAGVTIIILMLLLNLFRIYKEWGRPFPVQSVSSMRNE